MHLPQNGIPLVDVCSKWNPGKWDQGLKPVNPHFHLRFRPRKNIKLFPVMKTIPFKTNKGRKEHIYIYIYLKEEKKHLEAQIPPPPPSPASSPTPSPGLSFGGRFSPPRSAGGSSGDWARRRRFASSLRRESAENREASKASNPRNAEP